MQKISSFHQLILTTLPILESCDQKLLIYVNLYQHAKNQAISVICSGDMID